MFLWGGRVLKGRSWGRVDVLVCYGCVAYLYTLDIGL